MLDRAPAVFIPGIGSKLPRPLALPPAMTILSLSQAADLEALKARLQALEEQVLRAQLKVLSQKVATLTAAKEEGF